jgi:transporter family-2 protein
MKVSPANKSLSKSIDSVVYSALMLFVVGLAFISSFLIINRVPFPGMAAFTTAPAYSYVGGLIVATYVLSITYLAPRMGVGKAICFIVTGQIIVAVLIDHFGLLGAAASAINIRRLGWHHRLSPYLNLHSYLRPLRHHRRRLCQLRRV